MSDKPGDGKSPLTMEMRLLLAFLLMGLVLFVTPYLYKGANQPAPKGTQNVTPQKAAEMTKEPEPAPAAAVAPPTAATQGAAPPVQGDKEESFTVDTQLYRVVLSN